LSEAVSDLSWLLSRDYAIVSAVKLVGDRWSLTERQRLAIRRSSCSSQARADRLARRVSEHELHGARLRIDGFNVVTTVESALGGGIVLACHDGTFRDLAGVHGTYRKVAETLPALERIGKTMERLGVAEARWLFDRPVSNSGRIRAMLEQEAETHGWSWSVELVDNPDPILKAASEIVVTADSAILDRCGRWFNLARSVIEAECPGASIIELSERAGT
jgi:hypothetical protein